MRKLLGFRGPVKMLLVMGANRSGKSEYAAKRGSQMLARTPEATVYPMHFTQARSVRDQQPLFWKYLPAEWKVQQATERTYIKYKLKTGFSESSYITPIGAMAQFLFYEQDRDQALEGIEADLMLPDELVGPDWIEAFPMRIATRSGRCIITFTPKNGYTPAVQIFLAGAERTREGTAYMCPRDGGRPDEARTLGLTEKELAEVRAAAAEERASLAPWSRTEDVIGWLEGKPEDPAPPEGRAFERLPRVMRCADPEKAVIFFWPRDNPYGRPWEVTAELRTKGRDYVHERGYGWTERTLSVMFPRFRRGTHTVPARELPPASEGMNVMFMDPAENRNYFLTWMRILPKRIYVAREWPGNYRIPGIGVPGPWAIPSGRNEGRNDGAVGEAQRPWGFGNVRYKFEVARLEGWPDYRLWKDGKAGKDGSTGEWLSDGTEEYPGDEEVVGWMDPTLDQEPSEFIEERYIDSRAASKPRVEGDRPVTLQTLMSQIGLEFQLTPGGEIGDGVSGITTLLDATPAELVICEECANTIFALENWMLADGQKGATKDPIDNIRYLVQLGLRYQPRHRARVRGGFALGARRGILRAAGPAEKRVRFRR
jgi:hypothetical protein